MSATPSARAAIAAWESNDVEKLSSCLAENVVCRNLLPQPIGKASSLRFMQAMMRAIPDWSFQASFLNEHPTRNQRTQVHFAIQISGTHTGDLFIAELPVIPPTGIRIALPLHHMDFTVKDELIEEIDLDSRPHLLAEVLAALGMEMPL
ncbi:MAG TPA: nuclear transport factor 2 family protein [Ktedonobacteraceae bacterium]|jgi:hypothetical protein|nr:nuclear transport factor 2 family protein [Ktedonobacteraceae bacterium]